LQSRSRSRSRSLTRTVVGTGGGTDAGGLLRAAGCGRRTKVVLPPDLDADQRWVAGREDGTRVYVNEDNPLYVILEDHLAAIGYTGPASAEEH
jgi:hypothetical protein